MKSEDEFRLPGPLAEVDAYHRPPEVPLEEMWTAIEDALSPGQDTGATAHAGAGRPWRKGLIAGLAAAAILLVGVGLGRVSTYLSPGGAALSTTEGTGAAAAPTAGSRTGGDNAFHFATSRHMEEAEAFLSLMRTDARVGQVGAETARRAETLLLETRLLLDSPAVRQPGMRRLLDDLELILAQVARLGGTEGAAGAAGNRRRTELAIITAGMDQQDVLPRLQAALPLRTHGADQ